MRAGLKKPAPVCYCQACGRTVAMSQKFCQGCGALLGDIQCPKCSYLGPPQDFIEGCPKCLYLNAKANTGSGILHLDTLKKAYATNKNLKEEKESSKPFHPPVASRPSSLDKNSVQLSFFANIFILIILSFAVLGGVLCFVR